jgi:hypothetical protein
MIQKMKGYQTNLATIIIGNTVLGARKSGNQTVKFSDVGRVAL